MWDHISGKILCKCGGLDIRRFFDINSALLCKQGWKIVSGAPDVLAECLRIKYCDGKEF